MQKKYGKGGNVKLRDSVNKHMFKINKRNTRKRCETCSKLKIKTSEGRH